MSITVKDEIVDSAFRVMGSHEKRYYQADSHAIAHNGTAIEGVCVTGEAIRPVVPVVSKERVPVARRYGAIFAITAN
jgi:hypothetical protein